MWQFHVTCQEHPKYQSTFLFFCQSFNCKKSADNTFLCRNKLLCHISLILQEVTQSICICLFYLSNLSQNILHPLKPMQTIYQGFLTSFYSCVSWQEKERKTVKLRMESLALRSFVFLSGKSTQLSPLHSLGCPVWWGHRHNCCSLSSASFFSLDLTLLVLTPGLQSKNHAFSQASQTTLLLC